MGEDLYSYMLGDPEKCPSYERVDGEWDLWSRLASSMAHFLIVGEGRDEEKDLYFANFLYGPASKPLPRAYPPEDIEGSQNPADSHIKTNPLQEPIRLDNPCPAP